MKTLGTFIASAILAAFAATAQLPWNYDLYINGGGQWTGRLPVTVQNHTDKDVKGLNVTLPIDAHSPLVKQKAGTLRILDNHGEQLKFRVIDTNLKTLLEDSIPPQSKLLLPATLKPRQQATYYIYFGNPKAWTSPDLLPGATPTIVNGGFEQLSQGFPTAWQLAYTDDRHVVQLSTEKPASGKYCIKTTIKPNSPKTWFKVIHDAFSVAPGTQGVIKVKVRGENTGGAAGWYMHIGSGGATVVNRGSVVPQDTFDWTEVRIPFTVPQNASEIRTGSCFHGTGGTAWYDDFSIEFTQRPRTPLVTATPLKPEYNHFRENGRLPLQTWHQDYACRFPITITNTGNQQIDNVLVSTSLTNVRNKDIATARLEFNQQKISMFAIGNALFFKASIPPQTTQIFYLYVNDKKTQPPEDGTFLHTLGSDILSDQVMVEHTRLTNLEAFKKLLLSDLNLIKNPSFEDADGRMLPTHWVGSAEQNKTKNARYSLASPAPIGKRYASCMVPQTAAKDWVGWRQAVPVKPYQQYAYGAFVASRDTDGPPAVHMHLLDQDKRVLPDGYLSAQNKGQDSNAWCPMVGFATATPNTRFMDLHLTMFGTGTIMHDAAFIAPVTYGRIQSMETRAISKNHIALWQVDSIVKVFQDDAPTTQANTGLPYGKAMATQQGNLTIQAPFGIELAQNEAEPLQLAVRAGTDISQMTVTIQSGEQDGITHEIGVVGYVPVDAKSSYFSSAKDNWYQLIPGRNGNSDGWEGMWPDPIKPVNSTSLKANQTQPVWITFKTTSDTKPGLHHKNILLTFNGKTVTLPVTIKVWNFSLPQDTAFPAVYDLRLGKRWNCPGKTKQQVLDEILQLMKQRKVCPDRVPAEPHFFRNNDGTITADFEQYDIMAEQYFNVYKFPVSYTPGLFYLFGWAYPPKKILGEKPYDGTYPDPKNPNKAFRPEYVKAYQTCLKLFMDHMRQKGWDQKMVLYLSDEPHYKHDFVIRQMKDACSMIKQVEPKLPIYVSTWTHCKDWDGYISLWGAGHYGCFPEDEIRDRQAKGDRFWFTTDGQMCTDTPYAGIERMLPYYCFKYNAEAYEFWGLTWLTLDPWKYGWHTYHKQTSSPTEIPKWTRYPNGDGFLIYPGHQFPGAKPVTTVRLEAARDGVDDYEYLTKLAQSKTPEAQNILKEAMTLVSMPSAGGRYTTRFINQPERIRAIRNKIGQFLHQKP